jgi:signal transduction histidine kinase
MFGRRVRELYYFTPVQMLTMSPETVAHQSTEDLRLAALRQFDIMDSLTESDYDDITALASTICDTPVALISFVDRDRQWFKSHPGLSITETAREYSFCAHALDKPDDVLVIPNAKEDSRFRDNPLVTGDPNIVFYAGVPIVSQDGFGLGAVCVIDRKPRELTTAQLDALQILARQIVNLLGARKKNIEHQVTRLQLEIRNKDLEQFAMVIAHDIKSPLTSVFMANQMMQLQYREQLGEAGQKLVDISNRSATKIRDLVDGILSYYRAEVRIENFQRFSLADILGDLRQTLVAPKKYVLHFDPAPSLINMNKTQMEQIFFNLINNSIRYNDKAVAEIWIDFREDHASYYFSVRDNGIGITPENQAKVFTLFSIVSTTDQFGIKGSGIGLPTVKKIVENHGGSIQLQSVPGNGTSLSFTIKKVD